MNKKPEDKAPPKTRPNIGQAVYVDKNTGSWFVISRVDYRADGTKQIKAKPVDEFGARGLEAVFESPGNWEEIFGTGKILWSPENAPLE